jgi:hypothetical protein
MIPNGNCRERAQSRRSKHQIQITLGHDEIVREFILDHDVLNHLGSSLPDGSAEDQRRLQSAANLRGEIIRPSRAQARDDCRFTLSRSHIGSFLAHRHLQARRPRYANPCHHESERLTSSNMRL